MKTKSGAKPRKTRVREVAPIETDRQRIESTRNDGPLVFEGPRETIAASVPKTMAAAVREMVGVRGFSKFVTDALAREVVRRNRDEFVKTMEAQDGPLIPNSSRATHSFFRGDDRARLRSLRRD